MNILKGLLEIASGVRNFVLSSFSCVKFGKILAACVFLIVLIHVSTISYLMKMYVINPLTLEKSFKFNNKWNNDGFPKVLHYIHYNINGKPMSQSTRQIIANCGQLNSEYRVILWNESNVEDLIKSKYSNVYSLYIKQPYWISKIDIAKYAILHHMGGLYLDTDMKCLCPLNSSIQDVQESIVLYRTRVNKPQSDFIAAQKHHRFFQFTLENLHLSDQWYPFRHLTVMMTAGPLYLFGMYLNFPFQTDIKMLEKRPSCIIKDGGWRWMQLDSLFLQYLQSVFELIFSIYVFPIIVLGTFIYKVLRIKRKRQNRKHFEV